MPKLFTIQIDVEEIAVGKVMRLLHKTPGVASVDIDMGEAPKPNGVHKDRPKKPRAQFDITGQEFLLTVLAKRPQGRANLHETFEKAGRAPGSLNSVLHLAQTEDLIVRRDGIYHLTKKARDRARRKGA